MNFFSARMITAIEQFLTIALSLGVFTAMFALAQDKEAWHYGFETSKITLYPYRIFILNQI